MSATCFLLPVYNGTRYLREAIASVLAQSETGWTLLIVDDCSSDQPERVIGEFHDPRIRFVRNPVNRGLYGTLAHYIAALESEWVSIIMQDDRLRPDYLREMLRLAQQHPRAEAIWAACDCINAAGAIIQPALTTRREEPIEPGPAAWLGTLAQGCMWTISGSFTRTRLYRSTPFRTDLPHCGDFEWLLRAIRESQFLYWEYPLVEIRLHEGQASARNLRSTVDVAEAYAIVRDNFRTHAGDVAPRDAWRICRKRAMVAARRALGHLARGRLTTARLLFTYAFRFSALPLAYGR